MTFVYLLGTRLKNKLRALFKSPGGLISTVLLVAMLAVVVISGGQGHAEGETRDIAELYAIVLALFGVIFFLVTKNGLGKGTSLFTMADVNLIFAAPLSSRKVLLYGLVQQLGTSLLMGFFILFQYAWMRNAYGIGVPFVLAVMVGYGLTVFCAQLTAMALYVFTSGSDRRKRTATWGLTALGAAAALYVLLRVLGGQENLIPAAVDAANSLPLVLFPVAGWMRVFVTGIDGGNALSIVLPLMATGAYIFLLVRLITRTQADFYEDVLQATERSYSAVVSAKEGKVTENMPQHIKLGKTGLGGGWGASAFAYKHRLESRRARRFILDPMSLIMLATSLIIAYFMRGEGLLPVLIFSSYMQFFTVSQGRWVRELLYPYVYRVPEKPFYKLFQCLREMFLKQLVDAAAMALGMMLIFGLSPLETAAFVIFRYSFGLLFTTGLILVERLFTNVRVKWLAMILMMVVEMILALPGIVLAVYVSTAYPAFMTEALRALLLPAALNLPLAMLVLYFSRNTLVTSEMNYQ